MAFKDNSVYSKVGGNGAIAIEKEHLILTRKEQIDDKIDKIKNAFPSYYSVPRNTSVKDAIIPLSNEEQDKYQDDVILVIDNRDSDNLKIQTGNYIGIFQEKKHSFKITSRFGVELLNRMIDVINHFNIVDYKIDSEKQQKENIDDIVKQILFRNYVQNLKKSFAIGYPKSYQTNCYHEESIKGNIDVNNFIRKDNPFVGKISSKRNERVIDQNIVCTLNKAVQIIRKSEKEKRNKILSTVLPIVREINTMTNIRYSTDTCKKAIQSKSLINPIYSNYKKTLRLAKIIIDNYSINTSKKTEQLNTLLINVAELWEHYILNLLQINFPEWTVHSPKIEIYEGQFLKRKIIPDIVLEKENKVAVFDTKYKRMKYRGSGQNDMGDLDRNDFFQIHTYMAYYQGMKDKELLGGGLLYPIEAPYKKVCTENWLGNEGFFMVDGIELKNEMTTEEIVEKENEFIGRIKELLVEE